MNGSNCRQVGDLPFTDNGTRPSQSWEKSFISRRFIFSGPYH
jgi:hypothetical protein